MTHKTETEFAVAYDCPSCDKALTNSGGDLWVCPSGHMRTTNDLRGNRPWRDADGIWHGLALLSSEGR